MIYMKQHIMVIANKYILTYIKKVVRYYSIAVLLKKVYFNKKRDRYMKVFISQPMRGLSDEEITRLREEGKQKFLEIYKGKEEIEFISSFENDLPEDAPPLYFLGRAFQMLSKADIVLFIGDWKSARGCKMEHLACEEYGYTIYEV